MRGVRGEAAVTAEPEVACIALDPASGLPYVPGTSLAGVLRSALRRRVGHDADVLLWGDVQHPGEGGLAEPGAMPSLVVADDAHLLNGAGANGGYRSRTRVALDRTADAAHSHLLHSSDYVPVGSAFACRLELHLDPLAAPREPEVPASGSVSHVLSPERLLATLLDELLEVGFRLGRGTGAGQGDMSLRQESLDMRIIDLSHPEVLAAWLVAPDRDALGDALDARAWVASNKLALVAGEVTEPLLAYGGVRFRMKLVPSAPFLVANERDGGGPAWAADLAEAGSLSSDEPDVRPTDILDPLGGEQRTSISEPGGKRETPRRDGVPGSSLRGALRSRAERIVRTLWPEIDLWEPVDARRSDVEGAGGDPGDPASRLFGSTARAGLVRVLDAPADGSHRQRFDFVAIDRLTGGAADKLKFDAEAVVGGTLDVTVEMRGDDGPSLGLLTLVLCDLATGDLPVGSRRYRGFGSFEARWLGIDVHGPWPSHLGTAGFDEPGIGARDPSRWFEVCNATVVPAKQGAPTRRELLESIPPGVREWLADAVAQLVHHGDALCREQVSSTESSPDAEGGLA